MSMLRLDVFGIETGHVIGKDVAEGYVLLEHGLSAGTPFNQVEKISQPVVRFGPDTASSVDAVPPLKDG
jgi:hypothetical protein